jgi:hypothetical protein
VNKTTIRFYEKDVWISYKDEKEAHLVNLRISYNEAQVFFTPKHELSISEQYISDPLKILRLGHYQDLIQSEE